MHWEIDFGGDHDFVAASKFAKRAPDDLLAGAVRICVRGVEEVDAQVERLLNERATVLFVERPGMRTPLGHAVRHAAEADARNIESGIAELYVVHGVKVLC